MRQPLFVKNTPIDEKRIAFIEKIVSRLARRTRKVATAVVPPVPLSTYASDFVSGLIAKFLVFEGNLSKVAIAFDKKPKTGVKITIHVTGITSITSRSTIVNKIEDIVDVGMPVSNGSIIEVHVDSSDENEISEVWTTLLWIPSRNICNVEREMIDKLEESMDGLLEEQ